MRQLASQLSKSATEGLKNLFTERCSVQLSFCGTGPDKSLKRISTSVSYENAQKELLVFSSSEDVTGKVTLNVRDDIPLDHNGVLLEFLGKSEVLESPEFSYREKSLIFHLTKSLLPPGKLEGSKEMDFEFASGGRTVHESYYGTNAVVRYFVRVTISRGVLADIVGEQDIFMQRLSEKPSVNPPIKMHVGVPDCLQLEVDYPGSHFGLDEALTGIITFRLVRLNILSMEIAITRVETTDPKTSSSQETVICEAVAKYQIMDGAPARAESIPIRWPLSGERLTPSYMNVLNKFSVRYWLKLALLDEHGRHYYKQNEIFLHRKGFSATPQSWATEPGVRTYLEEHASRPYKPK